MKQMDDRKVPRKRKGKVKRKAKSNICLAKMHESSWCVALYTAHTYTLYSMRMY